MPSLKDDAAGPASSTPEKTETDLDEETLLLLGDAPKPEEILGPNIHKDVALRWQEVVAKGLPKEAKEKLLKEYTIPGNCDLLVPPILNPEVKVALPDTLIKRDAVLMEKQKQMSIALAALAQATQLILNKEPYPKILKAVSDASRILCDSHFNDTKTRRGFVISATNTELKDTLLETKRDKYLFGDNVSDKLKSAKTIQKSGADLKQNKNPKFNKNNFTKSQSSTSKNYFNTKPQYRRITNKPDAGKPRQTQTSQKTSWRNNPPPPRPRRSPARRPARRS